MVLPVPVGKTSKGRCTPRAVAASRAATASYWYGRGVSRNVVGGWTTVSIKRSPSVVGTSVPTPCPRAFYVAALVKLFLLSSPPHARIVPVEGSTGAYP